MVFLTIHFTTYTFLTAFLKYKNNSLMTNVLINILIHCLEDKKFNRILGFIFYLLIYPTPVLL